MKRFIAASAVSLALASPAMALDTTHAVTLVEMPVAVTRVAEVQTVEQALFGELLDLLFDVELPPAEFIDIVRYAPVLLVEDRNPDQNLIELIQLRQAQGLEGAALAQLVRQDLRTWGIPIESEIRVVDLPRVTTAEFFPQIVVDRIGYDNVHPHGGPPGQVKKRLGLQTGAEVVHGTHPGRSEGRNVPRTVVDRDRDDARNEPPPRRADVRDERGPGNSGNVDKGNPNKGNANKGNPNKGNANKGNSNKGKGKGDSR